jgi:hypothetical protein
LLGPPGGCLQPCCCHTTSFLIWFNDYVAHVPYLHCLQAPVLSPSSSLFFILFMFPAASNFSLSIRFSRFSPTQPLRCSMLFCSLLAPPPPVNKVPALAFYRCGCCVCIPLQDNNNLFLSIRVQCPHLWRVLCPYIFTRQQRYLSLAFSSDHTLAGVVSLSLYWTNTIFSSLCFCVSISLSSSNSVFLPGLIRYRSSS